MEIDWIKLIDKVKQKARVESDNELAELLGVTRGAISQWRTGRTELGIETKLLIANVLGYQFARDAILTLLPKKKAQEMIEKNNEITKRFNQKMSEKRNEP